MRGEREGRELRIMTGNVMGARFYRTQRVLASYFAAFIHLGLSFGVPYLSLLSDSMDPLWSAARCLPLLTSCIRGSSAGGRASCPNANSHDRSSKLGVMRKGMPGGRNDGRTNVNTCQTRGIYRRGGREVKCLPKGGGGGANIAAELQIIRTSRNRRI